MKTISKLTYLRVNLIFYVNKLAITINVALIILIVGSVQSISADHSEPGIGIFKDETEVELVTIQDSNYQVYLQLSLIHI